MIRIVCDTNVLVSAILFSGNERKLLKLVEQGEVHLLTSRTILSELFGVLTKKFHFSLQEINRVEKLLTGIAEVVDPRETIQAVSDAADNRILECAVAGEAETIVTGDQHLLPLKRFRGIPVVSTATFLSCLKSE